MPARLDPTDDGRRVAVPSGELVELILPQNATTGYVWQLDPLPPGLTLVGDETELAPHPAGPGAAAQRRFTLRADAPGVITARLRREWEPPEAATSTFHGEIHTT